MPFRGGSARCGTNDPKENGRMFPLPAGGWSEASLGFRRERDFKVKSVTADTKVVRLQLRPRPRREKSALPCKTSGQNAAFCLERIYRVSKAG